MNYEGIADVILRADGTEVHQQREVVLESADAVGARAALKVVVLGPPMKDWERARHIEVRAQGVSYRGVIERRAAQHDFAEFLVREEWS
jgi:hypothetical protein